MSGVFYLLSIIAVFIVFHWLIRNDKTPEGKETTGLLAMKEWKDGPRPEKKPSKPTSRWRRS